MSLYVHVLFAPYVSVEMQSLALAAPAISGAQSACILIGRTRTAAQPRELVDPMLFDKGAHPSPAELNIAFSEIVAYLRDEGAGAKIVVEPLVADAVLRVDIALQKSMDGETWSSEMILRECRTGTIRTAAIPELAANGKARMKIRCTSRTPVPLRVWANEPRTAMARLQKLLVHP